MTGQRTSATVAVVRTYRNLIGIPSYHYEPVFGRIAHEVIRGERPDAVALELPPSFRRILEWGAGCWPDAVAGLSGPWVLPLTPGDSILEAFRTASDVRAHVALIDIDTAKGGGGLVLPGAELADRSGGAFFEAVDALHAQDPVDDDTQAREAAMASRLADMMGRHRLVVWVGGLAHWTRIVRRLETSDFAAPEVPVRPRRRFVKARLDAAALLRLTNNWPALVGAFGADPVGYRPAEHVRTVLHHAAGRDLDASYDAPESRSAIDIARTLLYARNLAATNGLRELPRFAELIQAAHATIGPRYASRLYALAMEQRFSPAAASLDAMTYEVAADGKRVGLKFRGRWLSVEPWNPPRFGLQWVPDPKVLRRSSRDAQYDDLPRARKGDRFVWGAYPPDETEWEAFVGYLLRRASVSDAGEVLSVPFSNGLEDGVDLRATIRHWSEDVIYVRQERRGLMNVRNGAIDWTSATETSAILQTRHEGGWNDPDSSRVGSASREFGHEVLQSFGKAEVTRRSREWSLITLDCPTWLRKGSGRPTFFDAVIRKELLKVQHRENDNVYAWLEGMFRFCTGKPFVYYSRYVPSPRIRSLAKTYDVELVWSPLHRIPRQLLRRHQQWRQLWLTTRQWETLQKRIDTARTGQWDLRHLVG